MKNGHMDVVQFFAEHHQQFIWQVLVPIFVWLVLVLGLIIYMFFKYTSGNWSEENPNPYKDETFGMPRGTFRAILTMTLLFVTIILELVNVRIIGFEIEIKEFLVAFQMMIAFYFGSKVMHHVTSADRSKTRDVAEASVNSNNGGGYANVEEGDLETDDQAMG